MSAPVEFAVWAPLPERVRLQVDGAVHDMTRDDGGWWRAEVEAGPGGRLRLPARRQRHAPARSAVAPAARRGARPVAPVRPGRLRVGRRLVDRPPAGRRRRLRAARRHVHARGHAGRRDRPAGPPRPARRRLRRAAPACTRYWKKNIVRPPVSCLLRSIAVRTSGSWPCDSGAPASGRRARSRGARRARARTSATGPPTTGPPALGWSQPHSPERRTPKTSRPSPSAESTAPTTSSCGRSSTGASAIRRAKMRIAITSRTSPAKTQRHEK